MLSPPTVNTMLKKLRYQIHLFIHRHDIEAAKQRHQARLTAERKAKATALAALNTDAANTTVFVTSNALERGAKNSELHGEFRIDHIDVWEALKPFKQTQTTLVDFGGHNAEKKVEADVYVMPKTTATWLNDNALFKHYGPNGVGFQVTDSYMKVVA